MNHSNEYNLRREHLMAAERSRLRRKIYQYEIKYATKYIGIKNICYWHIGID